MIGTFARDSQATAVLHDLQLYSWIGLIVGLVAATVAGPLARILTFDAQATPPARDLADQLLERK